MKKITISIIIILSIIPTVSSEPIHDAARLGNLELVQAELGKGVDINFKQVYPLAIREPEFFKGKNLFTYFLLKRFDYFLQAKKLGMVFKKPNPDLVF